MKTIYTVICDFGKQGYLLIVSLSSVQEAEKYIKTSKEESVEFFKNPENIHKFYEFKNSSKKICLQQIFRMDLFYNETNLI